MSGYWIVMAMLFVALICVVVAAALETEGQHESEPPRRPVWVSLGGSAGIGLGGSSTDERSWTDRLYASMPPVLAPHYHDLSAPGSTIAMARVVQLPAALDLRPDAVTLWLVIDDLLAGTTLESYGDDLRATLDSLTGAGARVIVGNVPALLKGDQTSDDVPGLLRTHGPMVEDWNRAIARLADRTGVELIDLSKEVEVQLSAPGPASGSWSLSDAATHQLAARFQPAVVRALTGGARTDHPQRNRTEGS